MSQVKADSAARLNSACVLPLPVSHHITRTSVRSQGRELTVDPSLDRAVDKPGVPLPTAQGPLQPRPLSNNTRCLAPLRCSSTVREGHPVRVLFLSYSFAGLLDTELGFPASEAFSHLRMTETVHRCPRTWLVGHSPPPNLTVSIPQMYPSGERGPGQSSRGPDPLQGPSRIESQPHRNTKITGDSYSFHVCRHAPGWHQHLLFLSSCCLWDLKPGPTRGAPGPGESQGNWGLRGLPGHCVSCLGL